MSRVITGGLVAFEDGVKSNEEYAPAKKARVELRFDVPEDFPGSAEEALDGAMKLAQAKVAEMLGQKKATARAATPAATVAPAASGAAESTLTKDDLAKAAGVSKADEKKAAKKAPAAAKAPEAPKGDDLSEFDVPAGGAAAPAAITDADLNAEIQKKNAALKDPPKIRALVATFNPKPGEPFSAKEIAQEQRADFVAKLKALE